MKIAMIILAAGFSERMGVLKPLLPVGGESALLRTVSLGRLENIHCISVVTGNRCEDVEKELFRCSAKNIRHIYNKRFTEGMFTSVKAGIHSLPSDIDGFFLLPVDHCGIKPETVEKVIAAFILSNGQAVVYPTYRDQRGHPPLIPYSFAADIKDFDGTDGMNGYLSVYPFEEVDVNDPGIILDMDTPRDYETLLTHLGLPTYPDENGCRRLLEKYDTPDNIVAHCRQVNALALRMAGLLSEKGVLINKELLTSACLLHDMRRFEANHEESGAKLLLMEGFPATAMLIASHMDLPDDYSPKPDALALLYLADKLERRGRTVPIDQTVLELQTRYADDPAALAQASKRMAHAQMILDMLREQYSIGYDDILQR